MNIKTVHALGLTADKVRSVTCECGSKEVTTAYFLEADEYHITCKVCGNEGIAASHVAAKNSLSTRNWFAGDDSSEELFGFLEGES